MEIGRVAIHVQEHQIPKIDMQFNPHSQEIYVALQTLRDPKYQEKRQLRSGSKVSIIKLAVRDFS